MGIAAMGNRAALRQVQDEIGHTSTGSVTTVVLDDGATQPIGGDAARKSPTAEYLSAMAAWIPVEALAVWTALATPFEIFDTQWKEFVTVGLVAVASAFYSFTSVSAAQKRLGAPKEKRLQVRTAIIAVLAFAVWWVGTPGAWATADARLEPFLATVVLVLAVTLVPLWARRWGVDPVRTKA